MRGVRLVLVVVLATVLGASQASALSSPQGVSRPEAENYTLRSFNRVVSLLTAIWNKVGCTIDPLGGCTEAVAPPTDLGCGIDPLGRCAAATAPPADLGCGIDPWGRCGS